MNRLKTSLSVNAKYYAVVTVLFVAFLVYLLVRGSVQWADMVGFCVALANAWGLTLLVLSLGYGIGAKCTESSCCCLGVMLSPLAGSKFPRCAVSPEDEVSESHHPLFQ